MDKIVKLFFLLMAFLCTVGVYAKKGTNGVTLQGLDKVTAKVYSVDAPLGSLVKFGNLKIIVHQCHKSDPEDAPESIAYLTIMTTPTEETEEEKTIFEGHMFASSPAVSCLEHPVYDVWIKECKNLPKHRTTGVRKSESLPNN